MKKVLITGGGGDLAQALKERLSSKYLVDAPDRNKLDVTNIESVREYLLDKSFDVVVNAAGTLYSSLVVESEPELWIRDINVNLIGTYLTSKYALESKKDTRIINISSTAGLNSYKDWTSYCASKSGVIKLSLGLFKDGYDVIILCPGAIETKIRNGLSIVNNSVMSVDEGIIPIIDAVEGKYSSGDVVVYRKNVTKIIKDNEFEGF